MAAVKPKAMGQAHGYNLLLFDSTFYAVPDYLSTDVSDPTIRRHPEVVSGPTRRALVAGLVARPAPRAIEYAGWLPVFKNFGNCGTHPQFGHVDLPPSGYRFVKSTPEGSRVLRRAHMIGQMPAVVSAAVRMIVAATSGGASVRDAWHFARTRGFASQLLLPSNAGLIFLTSVPYTFGQQKWVIEVEDTTSMLYPFVHNGRTAHEPVHELPCISMVRSLLEGPNCRGIVTHVKSTAESIPTLFRSPDLRHKTVHVPLGMKPPPLRVRRRKPGNELTLLFTNSWHQNPVSFFLRGGLDVLSAIRVLKRRYPKLRVVLRTALPGLREPYQRILGMEGVEIIDRFLSKSEWDSLLRDADVYLLPAARIHVVSALQAMAHGLCVIASDGWGFDEYITHGHDGLLVSGRYGKTSWIERETGVLREDYSLMYEPNKDTTQQIVDYVTRLVEDRAYREMLQHNARVTVQEKFNLHQWNEGLRQLFDRALA